MSRQDRSCPLTRAQALELYFLEHRAKVLDLAAFLDRVDRARPGDDSRDFLGEALCQAIGLLIDGKGERARRILELLSDTTVEPRASAAGLKGAFGAPADKFQAAQVAKAVPV